MNKPNINLKYREQDGMMLPDLQISNSSEADQPLGRYGRMALETSERITRSDLRL